MPELQASILSLLIAFCIGSLCYLLFIKPFTKKRNRKTRLVNKDSVEKNRQQNIATKLRWPLAGICTLTLLSLIIGVGLGNLISRDVYLVSEYPILKVIGVTLGPILILGAGFMFGVNRKWWGFLLFALLFELAIFSIASRRLAVLPLLFSLGMVFGNLDSKSPKIWFLVTLVITPFLLFLPLNLRGLSEQGLIPYLSYLFSSSASLQSPYGEGWFTYVAQNILTGYPLTGYVMYEPPLEMAHLIVSITPLPSFLLNWGELAQDMRVNLYIPYNALGELLNYGLNTALTYFFFLGLFVTYLDLRTREEMRAGNRYLAIAILVFVILFIGFSTQYHLRSATRFLYYVWVILLLTSFYRKIKGNTNAP